jgi:hypothetical protein
MRGIFCLDISFICKFRISKVLFCVFVVSSQLKKLMEQERGSGDTTTIDIHTPLEASLNMSLRSACFTDKAFGKQQKFWYWGLLC